MWPVSDSAPVCVCSTFLPLPVSSEQQEHVSSVEEKLRSARSSLQELHIHCSQQKQTISELQAKTGQQSAETDGLRRRIEDLQQVRTAGRAHTSYRPYVTSVLTPLT